MINNNMDKELSDKILNEISEKSGILVEDLVNMTPSEFEIRIGLAKKVNCYGVHTDYMIDKKAIKYRESATKILSKV